MPGLSLAFGEFMARGLLERISPSHPAVMAPPGQTPYGLVHYACSIEEAVATEYSDDEMPVTDGGRRPQAARPGEPSEVVAG